MVRAGLTPAAAIKELEDAFPGVRALGKISKALKDRAGNNQPMEKELVVQFNRRTTRLRRGGTTGASNNTTANSEAVARIR